MSTVSRTSTSPFWQANFRDVENKRWNKSTAISNTPKYRSLADSVSAYWESIAKKDTNRSSLEQELEILCSKLRSRLPEESGNGVIRRIERTTKTLLDEFFKRNEAPSFSELADEFIALKKLTLAPTSILSYQRSIDDFIEFVGPDLEKPIDNFKREWLRKFQTHLANSKGVSNRTINSKVKAVRAVLKFAYREDHALYDYGDKVQNLASTAIRKRRPFTNEEIGQMWAVADEEWRRIIAIALYTGQRLGDIALMKWDDIDLNRGIWSFSSKKTNHILAIPLTKKLMEILLQLEVDGEFVNSRSAKLVNSGKGTAGTLSNQFADLLHRAGLRDKKLPRKSRKIGRDRGRETQNLGFHCFRYTAATALHEAGCPVAIAKEIIGHKTDAVHDIYVKPQVEAARKEVEKISKNLPLPLD